MGGAAMRSDEQRPQRSSRLPQYAATIVVDILHLIYGLGIGWSAIALPELIDLGGGDGGGDNATAPATATANATASEPALGFRISMAQGSWLAAVIYISAMPAMPLYSLVCERWGRRACGLLLGALFSLSAVLLAGARSFGMLLAARALFGLAAGGIFIVAPLYVAEIAAAHLRARLGAFVTLMRNVGILVAYALGGWLPLPQLQWAFAAPPLLFCALFLLMPETPVFLLRRGRVQRAERSLRWLRGARGAGAGAGAEAKEEAGAGAGPVAEELARLQASLTATQSEGGASASLKDLFATRGSRKAFIIGILMSCDQQLCGFFGVASYTFLIFAEASPAMQDASNVVVGAMLVAGIGGSMVIYDRVRRKPLLLASNFVMIAALALLSIYFFCKERGVDVSWWSWLPVAALSLYVLGYGGGVAALPIVILTEIFSPKIRNLALTTNGFFSWFIIFVVAKTFPVMTASIGFHGACWVYIAWCLVGVAVILTILPETKNRPLEEVLHQLEHGKRPAKPKPTPKLTQEVATIEELHSLTAIDDTKEIKQNGDV